MNAMDVAIVERADPSVYYRTVYMNRTPVDYGFWKKTFNYDIVQGTY